MLSDDTMMVVSNNYNQLLKGDEVQKYIRYYLKAVDEKGKTRESDILLKGYIYNHEETCELSDCPLKDYVNNSISKGNHNSNNITQHSQEEYLHLFAERMFVQNLSKFPNSTYLRIKYALFLFERLNNAHKALEQFLIAEKYNPPMDQRFIIYRFRKIISDEESREHNQGETLDIVSGIAYDSHYKQCYINIEKSAQYYLDFWELLLNTSISPDVSKLNDLGLKINNCFNSIEVHWNSMQTLKPNDPKAMKLYSGYLLNVLNDKTKGNELLQLWKETLDKKKNVINYLNIDLDENIISTVKEGAGLVICQYDFDSNDKNFGMIKKITSSVLPIFGYLEEEIISKHFEMLLLDIYKDSFNNYVQDKLTSFNESESDDDYNENSEFYNEYDNANNEDINALTTNKAINNNKNTGNLVKNTNDNSINNNKLMRNTTMNSCYSKKSKSSQNSQQDILNSISKNNLSNKINKNLFNNYSNGDLFFGKTKNQKAVPIFIKILNLNNVIQEQKAFVLIIYSENNISNIKSFSKTGYFILNSNLKLATSAFTSSTSDLLNNLNRKINENNQNIYNLFPELLKNNFNYKQKEDLYLSNNDSANQSNSEEEGLNPNENNIKTKIRKQIKEKTMRKDKKRRTMMSVKLQSNETLIKNVNNFNKQVSIRNSINNVEDVNLNNNALDGGYCLLKKKGSKVGAANNRNVRNNTNQYNNMNFNFMKAINPVNSTVTDNKNKSNFQNKIINSNVPDTKLKIKTSNQVNIYSNLNNNTNNNNYLINNKINLNTNDNNNQLHQSNELITIQNLARSILCLNNCEYSNCLIKKQLSNQNNNTTNNEDKEMRINIELNNDNCYSAQVTIFSLLDNKRQKNSESKYKQYFIENNYCLVIRVSIKNSITTDKLIKYNNLNTQSIYFNLERLLQVVYLETNKENKNIYNFIKGNPGGIANYYDKNNTYLLSDYFIYHNQIVENLQQSDSSYYTSDYEDEEEEDDEDSEESLSSSLVSVGLVNKKEKNINKKDDDANIDVNNRRKSKSKRKSEELNGNNNNINNAAVQITSNKKDKVKEVILSETLLTPINEKLSASELKEQIDKVIDYGYKIILRYIKEDNTISDEVNNLTSTLKEFIKEKQTSSVAPDDMNFSINAFSSNTHTSRDSNHRKLNLANNTSKEVKRESPYTLKLLTITSLAVLIGMICYTFIEFIINIGSINKIKDNISIMYSSYSSLVHFQNAGLLLRNIILYNSGYKYYENLIENYESTDLYKSAHELTTTSITSILGVSAEEYFIRVNQDNLIDIQSSLTEINQSFNLIDFSINSDLHEYLTESKTPIFTVNEKSDSVYNLQLSYFTFIHAHKLQTSYLLYLQPISYTDYVNNNTQILEYFYNNYNTFYLHNYSISKLFSHNLKHNLTKHINTVMIFFIISIFIYIVFSIIITILLNKVKAERTKILQSFYRIPLYYVKWLSELSGRFIIKLQRNQVTDNNVSDDEEEDILNLEIEEIEHNYSPEFKKKHNRVPANIENMKGIYSSAFYMFFIFLAYFVFVFTTEYVVIDNVKTLNDLYREVADLYPNYTLSYNILRERAFNPNLTIFDDLVNYDNEDSSVDSEAVSRVRNLNSTLDSFNNTCKISRISNLNSKDSIDPLHKAKRSLAEYELYTLTKEILSQMNNTFAIYNNIKTTLLSYSSEFSSESEKNIGSILTDPFCDNVIDGIIEINSKYTSDVICSDGTNLVFSEYGLDNIVLSFINRIIKYRSYTKLTSEELMNDFDFSKSGNVLWNYLRPTIQSLSKYLITDLNTALDNQKSLKFILLIVFIIVFVLEYVIVWLPYEYKLKEDVRDNINKYYNAIFLFSLIYVD